MILLIVDDQTNVVSGLISGINWDKLGIHKVLKAYNTYEAKLVLQNNDVDIILCDIEMPAENGLSLLRWIKQNNIITECIFLTAHADFLYAKEAIQLGGFDYILQPARYEDIESSIERAQIKILANRKKQEYSSYGKILYEKKDKLLDHYLSNWFLGNEVDIDGILKDFKELNLRIEKKSQFYLVLFNILRWHPKVEAWENQLLKASLNNIISELFEHYGQRVLLAELDKDNFIFIVFNANNQLIDEAGLIRQLEYFIQVCRNFFRCSVSCYTDSKIYPDELASKGELLLKMRDDNVTLSSRVFFYDKNLAKQKEHFHEMTKMKHWARMLEGGATQTVRDEIISDLRNISDREQIDADGLKRFYQSYLQMLFNVAEKLCISLYHLFQDKEVLDKSLNSYNTMDQMYEFIRLTMDYFEQSGTTLYDTKNQIELVIQYIHNNIEKDIRRNDIAEAVFLNPDYLSRLFKKEVGIPLKEYIMICKMKEAQSLLKTTNLPISMIAVKVGYTNFSHFSQVYKKILGVTPVEDRSN